MLKMGKNSFRFAICEHECPYRLFNAKKMNKIFFSAAKIPAKTDEILDKIKEEILKRRKKKLQLTDIY